MHTATQCLGTVQKSLGRYRRGWAIKQQDKRNKGLFTKKIWNSTDYQLTHLLEFGHNLVSRDGTVYGYVKAFPHIRKTEEKYQEIFFADLQRKIKRG